MAATFEKVQSMGNSECAGRLLRNQCGRTYASKKTLNAHEKKHPGSAPYRCCGKMFGIEPTFTDIGPPKKPEPPKMIVETVQFNPSVCTCGEHGCQPQYRMEKRVLWTNKEVCNEKKQSNVNDREEKNDYRENKFEERITKQDRKIGSVIESEQIGLKKEKYKEILLTKESDGNKCGSSESFKERMSSDVEVRSGYKAKYAANEKENVEVKVDGDNDDEKEKEKKEECVCNNEVGYNDSKDDICIYEEVSDTNNIEENKNNGRKDRDNSEGKNSEEMCREISAGNDSESAFKMDCKRDGKSSLEHQIEKDQTTEDGDRVVERESADGDEENCREKRILRNNSDENTESCKLESKDEGLEDVEIASAFGIMAIYLNSELHSWMSFEEENASKKIH